MKRTLLAILLAVTTAHARPRITVDDSVPFTAKDLADAVEIRVRDTNVKIHIARSGDIIVITVGDRARALEVDGAAPHDLARVVALVIVSLAESPISTAPLVAPTPPLPPIPPIPPIAPVAPAPPPPIFEAEMPPEAPSIHVTAASAPPSKYALRATIGYQRTDSGVYTTPFLASLATSISPQVRFVASAGFDEQGDQIDTTRSVLGRLGIEGRFAALGIEIGGAGFAFPTCTDEIGTAHGAYGTARIYLPVARKTQLVLEAGGYYMTTDYVSCRTLTYTPGDPDGYMPRNERYDQYAGHVGVGVEWGL